MSSVGIQGTQWLCPALPGLGLSFRLSPSPLLSWLTVPPLVPQASGSLDAADPERKPLPLAASRVTVRVGDYSDLVGEPQDSIWTIPRWDVSFLPTSNPQQPKGACGGSNLALVRSPGFSCWLATILEHQVGDQVGEYIAHQDLLRWPDWGI